MPCHDNEESWTRVRDGLSEIRGETVREVMIAALNNANLSGLQGQLDDIVQTLKQARDEMEGLQNSAEGGGGGGGGGLGLPPSPFG